MQIDYLCQLLLFIFYFNHKNLFQTCAFLLYLFLYFQKTVAIIPFHLIMQEVALAGLYRTGFFEKAAFYGGTALRIFHGLDRFSEDLDFSLLESIPEFSLTPYFDGIVTEFEALGMAVTIKEKKKSQESNVESAFLKSETV